MQFTSRALESYSKTLNSKKQIIWAWALLLQDAADSLMLIPCSCVPLALSIEEKHPLNEKERKEERYFPGISLQ